MALSQQINPHIRNYVILILVIFVAALVIAAPKPLNSQKKTTPQRTVAKASPTPTITYQRIDTGEGSYATTTKIPGQMEFISPKLGISFLFIRTDYAYTSVREEGDKVYVYDSRNQHDYHKIWESEYVQVFHKDSNIELATAVTQRFLSGVSPKDCFVISRFKDNNDFSLSSVFITYPGFNGSDVINPNAAICPAIYTQHNGGQYFQMDKNHSNKYLFISVNGQSASFPADAYGKYWEDTLQFLP